MQKMIFVLALFFQQSWGAQIDECKSQIYSRAAKQLISVYKSRILDGLTIQLRTIKKDTDVENAYEVGFGIWKKNETPSNDSIFLQVRMVNGQTCEVESIHFFL